MLTLGPEQRGERLRRAADAFGAVESQARGELLSNTIFHRAREIVITTNGDPYAALHSDPGLRAILEASIYGESVTGAAILDKIIAEKWARREKDSRAVVFSPTGRQAFERVFLA